MGHRRDIFAMKIRLVVWVCIKYVSHQLRGVRCHQVLLTQTAVEIFSKVKTVYGGSAVNARVQVVSYV